MSFKGIKKLFNALKRIRKLSNSLECMHQKAIQSLEKKSESHSMPSKGSLVPNDLQGWYKSSCIELQKTKGEQYISVQQLIRQFLSSTLQNCCLKIKVFRYKEKSRCLKKGPKVVGALRLIALACNGTFSIQHQTFSIQHYASSIQHPAFSIEHRASSIEFQHQAMSIEHRASSIEHRASSIEHQASSFSIKL